MKLEEGHISEESKIKDYGYVTIPSIATMATLGELSLTRKPGLVDPDTNGAHDDMDYNTFLRSTAAISPSFREIPRLVEMPEDTDVVTIIKEINRRAINAMFLATDDVNTQKGLLILLNHAIFAAAKTLFDREGWDIEYLRQTLVELGENIQRNTPPEYGVIFELRNGLRTTFEDALPIMRERLDEESLPFTKDKLDAALREVFAKYIQKTRDGNIINRKGEEVMNGLRNLADKYFEETDPPKRELIYQSMIDYCLHHWVSPGGSADLISMALFFYYLERTWPKPER